MEVVVIFVWCIGVVVGGVLFSSVWSAGVAIGLPFLALWCVVGLLGGV